MCAEGEVCVIDLYVYCCAFNVAASTGGDTDTGTMDTGTTDTGTTTGTTDTGTTTGGDTDTGTTSESTTDDGCRDIYEATYACKPFPDACPSETLTLADCLEGQLCSGGLFDPQFANGVLDCGTPPHECY
ncbi:hypothetical protein [Nannocystis radixulma]|uniref:hypothetical protein n=1 Tax=Nannocystis radixulma TaxID=2995305 RepID=UPI00232D15EC|nr:hypothetical protein [Nannocystis radixulma]